MTDRLVWVHLPYATYGIVCSGGRVVEAPPIARWMVGKPEAEVARWLSWKGAKIVVTPDHHPSATADQSARSHAE